MQCFTWTVNTLLFLKGIGFASVSHKILWLFTDRIFLGRIFNGFSTDRFFDSYWIFRFSTDWLVFRIGYFHWFLQRTWLFLYGIGFTNGSSKDSGSSWIRMLRTWIWIWIIGFVTQRNDARLRIKKQLCAPIVLQRWHYIIGKLRVPRFLHQSSKKHISSNVPYAL